MSLVLICSSLGLMRRSLVEIKRKTLSLKNMDNLLSSEKAKPCLWAIFLVITGIFNICTSTFALPESDQK